MAVKVPFFPTYRQVRKLMSAVNGESYETLTSMRQTILSLTGTPQDPVDWTEPDKWIPQRLSGEEQRLAMKIWSESYGVVNPRHIRGIHFLNNSYGLFTADGAGNIQFTPRGEDFLADRHGKAVAEIDREEGLLQILRLIKRKKKGKRSDFIEAWGKYLLENSNYRKPSVTRASLLTRINNLIQREYVGREGNAYSIIPAGLKWLDETATTDEEAGDKLTLLQELADDYIEESKQALLEQLYGIDPFQLEHLVGRLLDAMGYESVEVTKRSGDKGIDVVGDITVGVSSVKEVIQVKNSRSNVGRVELDKLRGSLHRYQAQRGSIITTGGFAKGAEDAAFELGAAPITLINGDTLVDLLIKHGIGVEPVRFDLFRLNLDDLEKDILEDESPQES